MERAVPIPTLHLWPVLGKLLIELMPDIAINDSIIEGDPVAGGRVFHMISVMA